MKFLFIKALSVYRILLCTLWDPMVSLGQHLMSKSRGKIHLSVWWKRNEYRYRQSLIFHNKEEIHKQEEFMFYNSNHTCWMDFTIIPTILGENVSILSRRIVKYCFPWIFLFDNTYLWIFHRNSKESRKSLFDCINKNREITKNKSPLVVFGEGTRNPKRKEISLKKGFLKYAFSNNVVVQNIHFKGLDTIFSEKRLTCKINPEVIIIAGGVFRPQDYSSFDAFYGAVAENFKDLYKSIDS